MGPKNIIFLQIAVVWLQKLKSNWKNNIEKRGFFDFLK